jgi:putative Mg2+ transporter-C (MgtC) family protein
MIEDLPINLHLVWFHFYQIGIAFILAAPIALNREARAEGAGLRTFPLVAISCTAFMLVALDVYQNEESAARIMYGIITGIGFIGGGSIIKSANKAHGTATAAGIWLTGAIGVSVAYQRYEIAIVLSLVGFLVFQILEPAKEKIGVQGSREDEAG